MKNKQGYEVPEQFIDTLAYLIAKYELIEAKRVEESKTGQAV